MSLKPPIARTRIGVKHHQHFATFSGDLNPLHVDAEAAQRMAPAGLLAYGMDMTLWALESLAQAGQLPDDVARIRVRFLKWVYLEDEITLHTREDARAAQRSFEVRVADQAVAVLDLFPGDRAPVVARTACSSQPRRLLQPRPLEMESMLGVCGSAVLSSATEAVRLYPRLCEKLGAGAVLECAACSYVVGMEAPGLYSMSMRYDLNLQQTNPASAVSGLQFVVTDVDPRFRKITVGVSGSSIGGTLEAFVRPDEPPHGSSSAGS